MNNLFALISKELEIKISQVENTVKLLDEGSTVPFISRYRKEVTGNLDENQIGKILKLITYLRNLEKRKEEVISSIEEQGKLTEDLKNKIIASEKLQEVEDLYLPYKKRKKTKADMAIEKGLEPLSQMIYLAKTLDEFSKNAEKYISEEVPSVSDAIEGAKLIVAQGISEQAEYREKIRNILLKEGIVFSKKSKKAEELDVKKVYADYYEYSETIKTILSHRVLALNRGEKENILKVTLKVEDSVRSRIENIILAGFSNKSLGEIQESIVKDSLDRLILPSIEREVRNILTDKSEIEAIEIFKENLKNLLLQPPLKEKSILGLDPGYRTGCKVAIVDKNGFYVEKDVFHLVEGMDSPKNLEISKNKILKYIDKYNIDIISIGNGTASRETESFVAKVIGDSKKDTKYIITNEAGASVYSASKIANEEFPDLDVTIRGAISIARRIQDPLGELVKIDPKSIGVGMYQHDVDQKRLTESLNEVIESVVNSIGINLNTASWALLEHVSGVKKNIAKNIVDYRKENGNFKNRKELLKVKGIGKKAYEQMAGFLIIEDGKNILDSTIIHPESYNIAEEILKENNISLKEYRETLDESREKLKTFKVEKFANEKEYGKETVKDIYEALIKDRRDPRDELDRPLLKSDIVKIDNLKPGMELEGTVRNVVKFGAFVDIGLKNDALLHISEISDKFVSDPSKELSVGEIIKVRVKDIDLERERVGLTRKKK